MSKLSAAHQAIIASAKSVMSTNALDRMSEDYRQIQAGHHDIRRQGAAKQGYTSKPVLFSPISKQLFTEHTTEVEREGMEDIGAWVAKVFGFVAAFGFTPEPGTKEYVNARPFVRTTLVYIMAWSYQDLMDRLSDSFIIKASSKESVRAIVELGRALCRANRGMTDEEKLDTLSEISTKYGVFQNIYGLIPALRVEMSHFPLLEAIASVKSILELQACASLLFFAMGKPTSKGVANAVQVARPKNLNDKFNNGNRFLFIGKQDTVTPGIQPHLIGGSEEIWSTDATMRAAIVDGIIAISYMAGGTAEDMLSTMLGLLAFSGMTSVYLGNQLLTMYPWVVDMPEVARDIRALQNALRTLRSLDPALRPYVKLREGDKARDIDSKSMSKLAALAKYVLHKYGGDEAVLGFAVAPDAVVQDAFDQLHAEIYAAPLTEAAPALPDA